MCHSCARVRGNDGFRILLTQPAPNVPIIDSDGATPPEDSVLLGYLLEVKGNNWKGVKVSQYWGGKVRVRSGWVFKQVASFFTGKAPSGVTQRPIYVRPDTASPLIKSSDGPAHFKEGYEA